jgi:Cu+-exporting ATPase
MRKTIKVSNITCTQCAKSIESYFDELNDVDAKVLVTSKKVLFNYDENKYDEESLGNHLRIIGYYPIFNSRELEKVKLIDRIDLILAFVLTFPLLWTMFYHFGLNIYVPELLLNGYFQWIITTPILFFVGRRFFKAAYHQVKAKNLGMDTLVVLGTSAAYIFSIFQTLTSDQGAHHMPDLYFETTAVIILMVLLGHAFENRVKEKTSDALQSLISLGAKEARIRTSDGDIMKAVDDVNPGDIMVVLANEKIALDGIILSGKSYIDEQMITGEPLPKFKEKGDQVIGSTMNTVDTLIIEVTKVGSDTILASIIQTVENTALIKPKAQRIADKISFYFVPVVVIISIFVFLSWYFIVDGGIHTLSHAFAPAIAVLVISCPCALGLATPTSISVGSGIAFKEGILYKGGEFFEIANKITAICFDKTGTLTKGEPELSDFFGDEDSFKYTASLEKHSNHPISKAIVFEYDDDFLEVSDFSVLIGQGIKGTIENRLVYVGSKNLLETLNISSKEFDATPYLNQGKTVFYTVVDQKVVNMIAISDPIKETAKDVIKELKRRNITPYMITGDQELTAKYIANDLGIDNVFYEVLPHEKANIVKSIQDQNKIVSFVGDGINDAPALKMSDVGFAVGSGSDIAIDTSDVTLMTQDLGLVIKAIDLSLATLKNIYVNFFWAFSYNILMIPLAAIGLLNPSLAGIGMGFSSIMVVLNALSLNLFRFKKYNS